MAPCLIFIDWQKAFRDSAFWGPRNNPDAEGNAARLLAHWRQMGWPVKHVRHDSTQDGSPLKPGEPGNLLEEFAMPAAGEPVYAKSVNSAFIGTTLEQDLRRQDIAELVFSGVTTDHCVNTTVRMAANLGFSATLAADACYTFSRQGSDGGELSAELVHEVHIASLNGEFCRITTTQQIITQ